MVHVIYKVEIIDRQKGRVKIPKGLRLLVRRICNSVLNFEHFDHSATVSVIFVDNLYIQSLNNQYRGKDVPTDMLSFPAIENGDYAVDPETGRKILGDIVISLEKAQEEAELEHSSLEEKVMYWTAHSLLHLLGYDHEKSKADDVKMRELAQHAVDLVGAPNAKYRLRNDAMPEFLSQNKHFS